jgi:hypothetical protein
LFVKDNTELENLQFGQGDQHTGHYSGTEQTIFAQIVVVMDTYLIGIIYANFAMDGELSS